MKIYDLSDVRAFDHIGDKNILISRDDNCFHEAAHGHSYYEIEYIHKGSGVQIINGKSYTIQAGDLIFFSIGDVHAYYSLENLSLTNCCFLPTEELKSEFSFENQGSAVIRLKQEALAEFRTVLQLLESELEGCQACCDEISQHCLSIILSIIHRNAPESIPNNTTWGKLLSHISRHFDTITLQEAADYMNLSVGCFCRKFKAEFGTTFHQHIKATRIQYAKGLLIHSCRSVSEIGELAGYSHPTRFHSDFKELTGTTPLKYRFAHQDPRSAEASPMP